MLMILLTIPLGIWLSINVERYLSNEPGVVYRSVWSILKLLTALILIYLVISNR